MIELRVLGAADIQGGADDGSPVLTQSKVLATLVFLVLATPHGFHRRDRIVGLLWPELGQDGARAALRKVVLALRRTLGDGTIVARGDEELAIAPDALWCDALEFLTSVEARRYARALDLYRRGDFLPGFFVPQAGAFEDWMDRERSALRDSAAAAAWGLAAVHADADDLTFAGRYARQAGELSPTDERMLRRVMRLLQQVGDRAGALHAYAEFARRMQRDLGAPPSAETQRLANQIREGKE